MANGYYSREELLQLWVDATDKSYNQPFVDKGDGGGLEVFNQAWSQFERVSQAVNNTFQSMYLLPWSGQTADPASGERYATVELSVSRDPTVSPRHFIIVPKSVVLERVGDHSVDGTIEVNTGRAYQTESEIIWEPGTSNSQTVQATSVNPGWGPNNPMPDTLVEWKQIGKEMGGERAWVGCQWPRSFVYAQSGGDPFIKDHIGQYLFFQSGWNKGTIRRIRDFTPTDGWWHAGFVGVESTLLMYLSGVVGTFHAGETVTHSGTGARAAVMYYDAANGFIALERLSGVFTMNGGPTITGDSYGATGTIFQVESEGQLVAFPVGPVPTKFELYEVVTQAVTGASGYFALYANSTVYLKMIDGPMFDAANVLTGTVSGATATPTGVGWDPMLVPEPSLTTTWVIMDWDTDLGITVTNEDSPSGGRSAMLDELGLEKAMPRTAGESDYAYRNRIAKLADTVAPNAIIRAMIRALDPIGVTGCFREVGTEKLKGIFYDVEPKLASDYAFAYDMDFAVRPADAWKVYLDFASYRAYFLIGIPQTNAGEFGFAYDNHPFGAYDSDPVLTFYDGYAVTHANALKALWNDINNRKAGGVGFDFYVESDGCV